MSSRRSGWCIAAVLGAGAFWSGGSIAGADEAPKAEPSVAPEVATSPETPASETALLRYQFQPGQVVRYLVDDKSTVDLEYGATREVFNYKTTSWKHYTVKQVHEDGSATVELVIDRAKMQVEGDNRSISFDTNSVGAPPHEFSQFVELIGKSRLVEVSATGVISAPEKTPAVFEKAAELDQQNTNVLIRLPQDEVSVGKTWNDDFDIQVELEEFPKRRTIRLRRLYTLTSLEGDVATIDLQTVVLNAVTDPKIEAQLIQRTMAGVIHFHVPTGRIQSREGRLSNEVVNFSGPGSRIKVDRTLQEAITADDGSKTVASSR